MVVLYNSTFTENKATNGSVIQNEKGYGIYCAKHLKIYNGTIEVHAYEEALYGKNSVRIGNDDDDSNYKTINIVIVSTKEKDSAVLNGKKIQVYGGTLNASGASVGIKADKSVTIKGGAISVHSDASGIKISDKEDTNFSMYDGTLFIETKKHGIVADYVTIKGVGEAKKNVAYPSYNVKPKILYFSGLFLFYYL